MLGPYYLALPLWGLECLHRPLRSRPAHEVPVGSEYERSPQTQNYDRVWPGNIVRPRPTMFSPLLLHH